jgi:hypothetical protein
VAYILLVIAGLLNGAVMLANGGHMPVLMPYMADDNVHVDLTAHSHLRPLADVYGNAHVRYSLGDVFCAAALMVWLVSLFAPKKRSQQ